MINTEELILGKDYYNYVIANPKLYQLIGWEINSEEDIGIRERCERCYEKAIKQR